MNKISQTPFIRNEKQWYCLSLFYAREKWDELIHEIMRFYQERQHQFSACLLTFSKEKGEHIQIALAVSCNDTDNYSDEIQTCFQSFLASHPSTDKTPFPYGEAFWCNYPDNSLIWNKLMLPDDSEVYLSFHQRTIGVALDLLAGDFAEDNFLSLGIYLLTKALCCIDGQEQINALSEAHRDVSIGSSHFIYTVKEVMNVIDINEVAETIELYKHENTDKHSVELTNWLNEVRNLLGLYSYGFFCTLFCEIVGLKGLRQVMLLELMYICFNRRQNEV